MATTDTKINIEVGAFLNKQEYEQVAKQLENLMHILNDKKNKTTTAEDKKLLEQQFKIIEKTAIAYDKAFSSKTGQINISKLNEEMKKSNVTVEQFRQAMAKSGQEGAQAYNQWANSILNANIQLKESNKLLDRMAVTFKNTIRYGISSSIFNNFTNSVQKAYNYTKNLDTSLNDIRIVSGQSAEQMADLAVSANKAAQALGKTTLDYTKAATIYYQQGLNSDEVEKRTEATLKAANVTGQNAQEVSEQLTAVWNGYRVTGEELELYVDKLAAVAAHSASNLEELSTGMSKVASAANIMGVSIDQLTAQMSTIVSVTRQAPESVGTALRTIYARMADIKSGLDDETSLGNYSGKMKKLGFDVLDSSNNLKDMGVVIEEVGNKWKDLSREQQVALAQVMAGTRQYNNLLTLFDNWDKYQDALEIAGDAAGTLQQQQDIYMESTAAHLEQLQATAEETYSALFDQETARDFIDLVTSGLSTINKYLNGLNTGALGGVLGQLGTLGANLFSGQIASGISGQLNKNRVFKENQAQFQTQEDILKSGYLVESDKNASLASKNRLENRAVINEALGGMDEQKQQELLKAEQELFQLQVKKGERLKQYREDYNKLVDIEKDSKKIEQDYNNIVKEKVNSQEDSLDLTKEQMDAIDRMSQLQKARENWDQYTDEDAADAEREDALTAQIAKSAELGSEQQRINDIIRGTTALLGTWNNLMTGINLVTDENLSTWEKFQGLVGVAGTQLMLLLTSYQSLTNLMPALIIQTKIYTGEQFKEAAAAVGVAAAEGKELTIKQAKEAIEKMSLATKIKLLAIKIKEWVVEKGKLITEQAALIIGRLTNVQKTIEIAQRAANTAAINGENVALAIMKALLGDISGVALVAAVAVGALAVALGTALVAIIEGNTGINGYNKAIEEAAAHTQEVKDAYNELKETMSSYKDARNGIDQLTLGTLEYYDAILKANEEAQKLIDKMHLIAGEDYTISDGGLIQISDEKLDELQFKEQQKVYRASAAESEKKLQKAQYQLGQSGQKLQNAINEYSKSQSDSSKTGGGSGGGHIIPNSDDSYNITKWDLDEKAVYSQAYEEAQAIKRTLADQIIRGYASKADVAIYNSMNAEGQKIAQSYVAQQAEKSSVDMGAYNLLDTIIGEHSKIPVIGDIGKWFGKTLTDITPDGPFGGLISTYFGGGYGAKASLDKELREQYAAEELNYEKRGGLFGIGGRWYKKDSEIDVTDEVNQLDAREIATLKESGAKGGQKAAEQIVQIYSESLSKSAEAGFGETSQKYIANAKMALATGQKVDYTMLNDQERQQLLSQASTTESVAATVAMSQEENAYNPAKRTTADLRDFNDALEAQAASLDTTTSALKMYGLAMKNAGELTGDQNAEMADAIAASYKFNKAYNEAIKVYKNNTDAIDDYVKAIKNEEQVSYETADAMGELYDQLKGIFGDRLSPKLLVDNMDLVKQLLTGTEEEAEEAYRKLESLNIQNVLSEQFGDEAINKIFGTKEALADFANHIANLDFGQSIGQDYFNKLKQMVNTSKMTKEEVESLFASMNLKTPPLKITNQKVDIPGEKVHHDYNGTAFAGTDIFGNPKLVHVEYGWDETTTPVTKNFVTIGDNVKADTVTSTVGGGNYKKAPSNTKSKSGSTAKPTKKDLNKDELDRYQLVNVQLKEISKQMSALEKQKKKLLGGNLVKNLNKQISLLDKQIDTTERKLKIAEQEQAEVAQKLAKVGVKFDNEGNISNYAAIFKQEQNKLNNYINFYNGLTKKQQEARADELKQYEENWKTFKENITKYDSLIGETIPQLQQDIQDAFDKQTEMLIEKFNMEIDLRLDINTLTRDWNEFRRKVIDDIKDDDILGTAKAKLKDFYSYFNDTNTGDIQVLTNQLQKQLEEVKKQMAGKSADWYRDNEVEGLDKLKERYEQIKDSLIAIVELEEEMHQKVLDMLDETQEKFNEQLDIYENIGKQLEHNVDLINLLSDGDDYENLSRQYALQTQNRKEQLDFYTKQKEYWSNYMRTLQEGSEEWENAKEKYNAAADAWASALKNTIETARTEFENNIKLIFKTINNQLTNGKGLDYLDKEWQLINENSELALDNINRLQGIQNISKKYTDAINGTSNITAQKKLAELRDKELEQLKTAGSLNEKDLERAEKKLDIAKAQIALEDAQRNKTTMRLRRDSQGNYRYQFVADEDEINKAQEQLSNAYNELYNFDKERFNSTSAEIYEAYKAYQEELANIALINDPVEKQKQEELVTTQWHEKKIALEEQLARIQTNLTESTFANLNSIYAKDAEMYELFTTEQQAALNGFEQANQTAFDLIFGLQTQNTDNFRAMTKEYKDTILGGLIPQTKAGIGELLEQIKGEEGFQKACTDLWQSLEEEAAKYQAQLESIKNTGSGSFGSIEQAQQEVIRVNSELLNSNDELIDKYAKMTAAIQGEYEQLKLLMAQYKEAADQAKQAAEDAYETIKKYEQQQADDVKEDVDKGSNGGQEPGNNNNNNNNNNPGQNPPPASNNFKGITGISSHSQLVDVVYGIWQGCYGTGKTRYAKIEAAFPGQYSTIQGLVSRTEAYKNNKSGMSQYLSDIGYDTGGYTGEWGNNGRLAFLHQKELVLNKQDTANMLNAVEIMRGITENIGADLLGRMAGITAGGFNSSLGNGVIDQNVHIEATFPGVKNAVEIETALNNLVNMASQRALQK